MKINKNVTLLSSRLDNFKFNLKRGKGHLFSYMLDRFRWHIYPRIHVVSKFPTHIDLELSNACNLGCPMCYTTTDEFKSKIKKSLMDYELFKKIIDECTKYESHYSIRLSWRGEPFLHPKIIDMIRYAKSKGIKEVSTLTHGGFLDPEKFEELLKIGLDWLTISFDGVDETYEQIRFPLKYEESLEKIKKYHEIKKKYKSVKPIIKVQGVWPAVAKNPEKYFSTFAPITDQVASPPLLDYLRMDTDIEYIKNFTCPVLYQRMTVDATGEVKLCFNDEMGTVNVGDLNSETVYQVWHGKKLQKARETHLKHLGVKELDPCKHCFYPRKTEKSSKEIDGRNVTFDGVSNRSQTVGT
ncbi:MAG: radical SAM/SPASM domain-containing protein [Candidatus Nitrosopumilus sp. bin_32a]